MHDEEYSAIRFGKNKPEAKVSYSGSRAFSEFAFIYDSCEFF